VPWSSHSPAQTSGNPTALQAAVDSFNQDPSKPTAWVLLVAIGTSDQAIAEALFRQAALDAD
jgi:hypothetical protein